MIHASWVYCKTTPGFMKISLLQAVEQQLAEAARIDPQILGRRRTREKAKNSARPIHQYQRPCAITHPWIHGSGSPFKHQGGDRVVKLIQFIQIRESRTDRSTASSSGIYQQVSESSQNSPQRRSNAYASRCGSD